MWITNHKFRLVFGGKIATVVCSYSKSPRTREHPALSSITNSSLLFLRRAEEKKMIENQKDIKIKSLEVGF